MSLPPARHESLGLESGIRDVEGLAFHPTEGTLWGVAGNNSNLRTGSLLTINPATAAVTMIIELDDDDEEDIEGLTWSIDGTKLDGGDGDDLFQFDFVNEKWNRIESNTPWSIEGLETVNETVLLIGVHENPKLFFWSLVEHKVVDTIDTGEFADIEGITLCKAQR